MARKSILKFANVLFVILIVCLGLTIGVGESYANVAAQTRVGQWDRFEIAVTNSKRYADSYKDVNLTIQYTRPNGSTVDFWGFYDGGQTWKARFMPDQLGTWRYAARFSDGTPGASGKFEVVASDIPGMIHKDETNPIWFGFKGGKHILIRSFHGGPPLFAPDWNAEKRKAFLDWVQQQGYNMLSVAGFIRSKSERLWPLDSAEYRQVEAVLDELSRRKILVYPFHGFFHGGSKVTPADPAEQEQLIKYMLARFGPYWNLIFNVSGAEPNLRNTVTPNDIQRLGSLIDRFDVFDHLLGVHNKDGDDPYRTKEWSSFLTLQHEVINLDRLNAYILWNHTGTKPVYGQETCWTGNILQFDPFEKTGGCTLDRLRQHMWVHMMSAAVFNAGDMNGRSSSGFSGSLELSEKVQARHDLPKMVWDFMESVPFYRMSPQQGLVTAGFCLAEPGEQYLVYLPEGGSVDVRLEGNRKYEVTWINARDTKDRRKAGTITRGQGLTAPAETGDWVLYIKRIGGSSEPVKEDV